jgi:hypothetical protein
VKISEGYQSEGYQDIRGISRYQRDINQRDIKISEGYQELVNRKTKD